MSVYTNLGAVGALLPGRTIETVEGDGGFIELTTSDGLRVRIEVEVVGSTLARPGELTYAVTPPPYPAHIPVRIDFQNPPVALVNIPPEPDATGPRLSQLHDDALALAGIATPFFSLRTENTLNLAAENNGSIKACDCQPAGMVASNHRSHCIKISNSGTLCTCWCHPENR